MPPIHHHKHHHHKRRHYKGTLGASAPASTGPDATDSVFDMKTGNLYIPNKDGTGYLVLAAGSGNGQGHDNADMAAVKNVGTIPPGEYAVSKPCVANLTVHHKPTPTTALRLTPIGATDVHGRDGFLMHQEFGTNYTSHGCVVVHPDKVAALTQARTKGLMTHLYVTPDASTDPTLMSLNHFAVAEAGNRLAASNNGSRLAQNGGSLHHRRGHNATPLKAMAAFIPPSQPADSTPATDPSTANASTGLMTQTAPVANNSWLAAPT